MPKFVGWGAWASCFLSLWIGGADGRAAGKSVEVVVGDGAPQLERLAAEELAGQLQRLFAADVRIVTEKTNGEAASILLGSPATNPAVRAACGSSWPQLSQQGHLVRTVQLAGRDVLVVGGATPRATLWSVYELGHRFGMRSLLQGDFLPIQPRPFTVAGFDSVFEPSVTVRAWQSLDGGPLGWEAWGMADHQRMLRQLAKLRFNRVVVALGPTQPFFHFEAAGVSKSTGVLFAGRRYPVDGDTAGRKAFRGANQFDNPDFLTSRSYDDRLRAGTAVVQGILQAAHELGMTVGVQLSPWEFPPEIAGVLSNGDETGRLEASVAQLRACLETYPQLDALYLSLPRDREQAQRASKAWQLVAAANPAASQRGDRPLELHWLGHQPSALVPIELFQPSAGVLPQRMFAALSQPVRESRTRRDGGWLVHAGLPSDAELSTYYLSRSAWEPELSPEQAADELITTIVGPGIAERLMKGFAMVEQAAQIIEKNSPTFAAPHPEMVLQHAQSSEPPPAWWGQVRTLYTDAMNEMYRGNTRARDGGRAFTLYFARRYEFGLTYMASLESLRQSAVAKSQGDRAAQQQYLEAAVEGMYNALGAFSEVARDPSDRGLIAALNAFGYRPLMTQLEAIEGN